ncbi:Uncharacterised protein [Amycolatopsis camponoti]|uniref:Uncharacterized protein n=1 Tax=Amycolatopsis camponoti TaxID=2606593 RepID=A0A6I8LTD1_9PSEU|nr:Uncharacterised protein [Amycolatopsis camponoti]
MTVTGSKEARCASISSKTPALIGTSRVFPPLGERTRAVADPANRALLLFLFVGVVRRQVLEVDWKQVKAAIYNRSTKTLAVYTTGRRDARSRRWLSGSPTRRTHTRSLTRPNQRPPRRPARPRVAGPRYRPPDRDRRRPLRTGHPGGHPHRSRRLRGMAADHGRGRTRQRRRALREADRPAPR